MATVVTSDNVPAVLTQLAERLDEQDARIEALIALQTDQATKSGTTVSRSGDGFACNRSAVVAEHRR